MQLGEVIKSLSVANAAIKNTASPIKKDGWYPTFSASGQDVWLPDYRFDQKGIVVSAVGARCGKAFKADGRWNVCANTHVLSVDESIADRDYCWYMLNNESWWIKGGTAQPFVKVKDSLKREHSFPSLSVQKRIVSQLDTITHIIELKYRELSALDDLIKARFVEMFGDPTSSEKRWLTAPLTGACSKIYGGGTPSKKHPEYFEGTIPWVSPKDMKSDVILDSIDHITEDAIKNSTTNLVPAGSVLMVIRSGILKHNLPVAINAVPVTINQDMKAFIPGRSIKANFLRYYFKAIEPDVLAGVRGVTADNIDFKAFQQREIIIPPINLQIEFEEFCKQIDKSKSTMQKSLDETQLLFDSLMQKYFG